MACETHGTNVFQSLGRVRQPYKVPIWTSDIDLVLSPSERKREIISKVVSIVDTKLNGQLEMPHNCRHLKRLSSCTKFNPGHHRGW